MLKSIAGEVNIKSYNLKSIWSTVQFITLYSLKNKNLDSFTGLQRSEFRVYSFITKQSELDPSDCRTLPKLLAFQLALNKQCRYLN